jgi:hypothetical protein
MITVDASVEIARPAAEVFTYLSDFARNPEWQQGMRSARWTSPPPVGVGSTYDQVAGFLGRRIVSTFTVVAYHRGRSVTIASTSGSFPLRITRTVTPVDDATSFVTAHVEGDAAGFFRLAEPLLRPLVARSIRGDYSRLKQRLEHAGAAGGDAGSVGTS